MKIPIYRAIFSRVGKIAACLMLGIAVSPQSAHSATSYATAVAANNPLAFWQLNETGDASTGTLPAADTSGHGLNGTYGSLCTVGIYLAPQAPTYPGFPDLQTAVYTSATVADSAIRVPALNLNTNTVTIAMWINPGQAITTFSGLLMNRTAAGGAAGFGFGGATDSTGMAALGYTWNNNAAATYNFNSGLFPVAGIWQFAALVIQTNSATIYLCYVDPNTSETKLLSAVNSIAHNAEAFSSGLTVIGDDVDNGSTPSPTRVFGGNISGVAVYQSALNPDQILGLFAAGVGANGFAPRITGQPKSQYITSGEKVVMSATGVVGTSPFGYQWQFNGTDVNLLPGATNFVGATSNVLTILSATAAEVGTYRLRITNSIGTTYSSNATVSIQTPALVGKWFSGTESLADTAGYAPAGRHDGFTVGGTSYAFTNDVPPGKTGSSLWLYNGDTGIGIHNSSTLDTAYLNTFDEKINHAMTVSLWAKGWPGGWNPFISKQGEGSFGWQLRQNGQNNVSPCWTIRGAGGNVTMGAAVYGDPADLSASGVTFGNDGNWHLYVGTYDAATGLRNLYVDGVLSASENSNGVYNVSPASYLAIGARDTAAGNTFGNFFTGLVYDARIYNYAIAASNVLELYGVIAPSIASQPGDAVTFAGSGAKFTVNASGTPPLNYQWRFNGTNIELLANSTNYTGINSNVLTILNASTNEVGTYSVVVSSALGYGSPVTSSSATLSIVPKLLVGRWLTGTESLADVSGYQPAGVHDAYVIGTNNYVFTNDVPPGRTGQSIRFSGGGTALAVHNSSALDFAYVNTFDATINNAMTVAVWAKGYPGGWNPWVSKHGESQGWQLRTDGSTDGAGRYACWTIRGGGGTVTLGAAVYSNGEDMATRSIGTGNDGLWHHYVGTFNATTGERVLYIDGEIAAMSTGNTKYRLSTNSFLCIGARDSADGNTFGNYFNGNIFDVQIFNYDLSSNEVKQLTGLPDPVIGGQPPATLTAYVGGTKTITASGIKGTAPLTYHWQLNGTNLVNGAYGGSIILGANTNRLVLGNVTADLQGVYNLVVSNSKGSVVSSNVTVTVLATVEPPAGNLVGSWLTGPGDLKDTSGHSPAGTHDGYGVVGTGTPSTDYGFTNDVPTGWTGQSLTLPGTAAIAISNSSTLDAAYVNTFDEPVQNAMTVAFWAKGWPASAWNPFVSKYGENGAGWQLRRNGGNSPCWTIRGTGGTEDMSGSITMSNDGLWHHYAGTFDVGTGVRNLYVDGVLRATQSGQAAYALSTASHLAIGGRDGGGNAFGNYFLGQLYGVRIYNVALSEAQVNNLSKLQTVLPPAAPAFSGPPVLSGNSLVIQWTGGSLLQATNVAGPWTPTGATSPYTNNVSTAPQMFYRVGE